MSSVAISWTMARAVRFWETTVGKKAIMAVTGAVLLLFVIGHLIGNLQIYQGPEKLNHYAQLLRAAPALLWGVRLFLLLCVILHVVSSIQLALLQREARPIGYYKKKNPNSTFASRTMIWGGLLVAAFIIYHLLHLTLGTVHPDFSHDAAGNIDVYRNVVLGFQVLPVSLFYMLATVLLGLHIYHGGWSMFHTLGFSHPQYTPVLKALAALAAVLITAGNLSIPLAVLTGIIHL